MIHRLAKFVIVSYQAFISPLLHSWAGPGFGCRFEPTCSEYARQAFARLSWSQALRLTFCRISRCHPFGGCGYDPIPVISPLHSQPSKTLNYELPTGVNELS